MRTESFTWSLLPDEEWDVGLSAHRFELLARTPEEVRRARDLERFADWTLASKRRELLSVEAESRLGWLDDAVEERPARAREHAAAAAR